MTICAGWLKMEAGRMEETGISPPVGLKSKRGSRLRLFALSVLLALCVGVYLPLRAGRANDRLMKSIAANDQAGVEAALASGADADLRMNTYIASDNAGSLRDFVRLFVHRAVKRPGNARTVLMIAVTGENEGIVKTLLAHGAHLNLQIENGSTALLAAASRRSTSLLSTLLANGADIHAKNRAGATALLIAAQTGRAENVKALLAKGEDIHESDALKQTALTLAVANRREETVKILLAAGADERDLKAVTFAPSGPIRSFAGGMGFSQSIVTVNGMTTVTHTMISGPAPPPKQNLISMPPLAFAAKNGSTSLLKYLWHRSSDEQRKQASRDILSVAVQTGQSEMVRFLLDEGATVNPSPVSLPSGYRAPARLISGYDPTRVYTPLHYAAALPDPRIARMLIEHGANVNAKDAASTTPLMAAASGSHVTTMRLLLEHGADVHDTETSGGQNALMRAKLNPDAVRLLLDHGIAVNAREHMGRTALMFCFDLKVLTLLLERGADVNARDAQGNSALLLSVKSFQIEPAKLLIKHGAALTVTNGQGETPLSAARALHMQSMADLLIAAGAKN